MSQFEKLPSKRQLGIQDDLRRKKVDELTKIIDQQVSDMVSSAIKFQAEDFKRKKKEREDREYGDDPEYGMF